MNCKAIQFECCCDQETDEQKYEKIAEIINKYKNQSGSLIKVLHAVQSIYGYLPLEVQQFIATGMDKPLSEVSSVTTFYSFFATQPKGKHMIRVCMGTACYVRGGKKLTDRLETILGVNIGETTEDRKYTLDVARCIGACGFAPAMMIDDVVYKQVNPEKLEAILAKY